MSDAERAGMTIEERRARFEVYRSGCIFLDLFMRAQFPREWRRRTDAKTWLANVCRPLPCPPPSLILLPPRIV